MKPLREVEDEQRFGGKAVQLGAALRAGLPVPDGFALSVELVDRVAAGEPLAPLGVAGPVAVRSSAVGEDSARASFAGQHLTRLNVAVADVAAAVKEVWLSGRTESALAYRARLGIEGAPRVAVVVQEMVVPECSGVLFTKNPVDGSDERVIEASWGLGEAIVAGLVEPDRFRLRRGGAIVERVIGHKDVAVVAVAGGGTEEREVPPADHARACLDDARLGRLEELAARCESLFAGAHDIEFAFVGARLYLLQRRAITR